MCSRNRQQRRRRAVRPGAATSVEEATEITNGWGLLAQGMAQQAAAKAEKVLAIPRSAAGVESCGRSRALSRGYGSRARRVRESGLGVSGRSRNPRSCAALRSRSFGRHAYTTQDERVARRSASRARVRRRAGRASTRSLADSTGNGPRTRVLAAWGTNAPSRSLAASLTQGTGNTVATVQALADSGSKRRWRP